MNGATKLRVFQPRTQAGADSRYPSYNGRLGTKRDRRIFPTSLTGDVTSEIAEDDWERGCEFSIGRRFVRFSACKRSLNCVVV